MAVLIGVLVALVGGQAIGAVLAGLSIAQLVTLAQIGATVGVTGIQLSAKLAHSPQVAALVGRLHAKHNTNGSVTLEFVPGGACAWGCYPKWQVIWHNESPNPRQ